VLNEGESANSDQLDSVADRNQVLKLIDLGMEQLQQEIAHDQKNLYKLHDMQEQTANGIAPENFLSPKDFS